MATLTYRDTKGSRLTHAEMDANWRAINAELGAVRVASVTALAGVALPAEVVRVQVAGWATAGDGGAAWWRRVASSPTHPMKIQDTASVWWELDETEPVPEMAGASGALVGNPMADSRAAIQNLIDYQEARGGGVVNLATGRSYLVNSLGSDSASGLIVKQNVALRMAWPGADRRPSSGGSIDWTAGSGGIYFPALVFDMTTLTYGVTMRPNSALFCFAARSAHITRSPKESGGTTADCQQWSQDMTSGFAGTGIRVGSGGGQFRGNDILITNAFLIGFDIGVASGGVLARHHLDRIVGDCNCLLKTGSAGDGVYYRDLHTFPFLNINAGTPIVLRKITGFTDNGGRVRMTLATTHTTAITLWDSNAGAARATLADGYQFHVEAGDTVTIGGGTLADGSRTVASVSSDKTQITLTLAWNAGLAAQTGTFTSTAPDVTHLRVGDRIYLQDWAGVADPLVYSAHLCMENGSGAADFVGGRKLIHSVDSATQFTLDMPWATAVATWTDDGGYAKVTFASRYRQMFSAGQFVTVAGLTGGAAGYNGATTIRSTTSRGDSTSDGLSFTTNIVWDAALSGQTGTVALTELATATATMAILPGSRDGIALNLGAGAIRSGASKGQVVGLYACGQNVEYIDYSYEPAGTGESPVSDVGTVAVWTGIKTARMDFIQGSWKSAGRVFVNECNDGEGVMLIATKLSRGDLLTMDIRDGVVFFKGKISNGQPKIRIGSQVGSAEGLWVDGHFPYPALSVDAGSTIDPVSRVHGVGETGSGDTDVFGTMNLLPRTGTTGGAIRLYNAARSLGYHAHVNDLGVLRMEIPAAGSWDTLVDVSGTFRRRTRVNERGLLVDGAFEITDALWRMQATTSGAASARLTMDGTTASSTNVPTLPNTTGQRFRRYRVEVRAEWTAGSSGAAGDGAQWAFDVTVSRPGNAASTTVVGGGGAGLTPTHSRGAGSAWTLDATADTTLAALNITGTGAANNDIAWYARVWAV